MKSTPELTRRTAILSAITAVGGCAGVDPSEQTAAVSGIEIANETPSTAEVSVTLRKQNEEVLTKNIELEPIGESNSIRRFYPVWTVSQTTYELRLSGGGAQPFEKAIPEDTGSVGDCVALSVQLRHTGTDPFEQSPSGGTRFFVVTAYDPAQANTFDSSCGERSGN